MRLRLVTWLVLIGPVVGSIVALCRLPREGVALHDVALVVVLYALTMLGITAGYHRLFTHRAFETHPAVRAVLAILGSMALQGPVIRWVAHHRRHHLHSDEAGDPHTPWRDGTGLRGLFHAHFGWMAREQPTRARRYAPDLLADDLVLRIDALYPLWIVLSLALPAAMGAAVAGAQGAVSGFLWGGLVRVFLVHHATWCVNSICHAFGERPFATRDRSTNNRLVAFLTLGEGWHNNHHAFPYSAANGLDAGQFDPAGRFIGALEAVGLAWRVRRPSARSIGAKRIRNGLEATGDRVR